MNCWRYCAVRTTISPSANHLRSAGPIGRATARGVRCCRAVPELSPGLRQLRSRESTGLLHEVAQMFRLRLERRQMDIHHVPRLVIVLADIAGEAFVERH